MQQGLSKSASWGFLSGLGVVYSTDAALVVSAIGVLPVADNDTGVQERATDSPQHSGDLARR